MGSRGAKQQLNINGNHPGSGIPPFQVQTDAMAVTPSLLKSRLSSREVKGQRAIWVEARAHGDGDKAGKWDGESVEGREIAEKQTGISICSSRM